MAIMAIPLVSLLDSGVEYDRPSLNPFCFLENFFASCTYYNSNHPVLFV